MYRNVKERCRWAYVCAVCDHGHDQQWIPPTGGLLMVMEIIRNSIKNLNHENAVGNSDSDIVSLIALRPLYALRCFD